MLEIDPKTMIVSPVRVLLEERDPERRAAAHLSLARRSAARGDLRTARHHYDEVLALCPGHPVAGAEARNVRSPDPPRPSGLLQRLGRRAAQALGGRS